MIAASVLLSLAAIALSARSVMWSREATLHWKAAEWNWQQVTLWQTDPAEARRRKANPPDFVLRSNALRTKRERAEVEG